MDINDLFDGVMRVINQLPTESPNSGCKKNAGYQTRSRE